MTIYTEIKTALDESFILNSLKKMFDSNVYYQDYIIKLNYIIGQNELSSDPYFLGYDQVSNSLYHYVGYGKPLGICDITVFVATIQNNYSNKMKREESAPTPALSPVPSPAPAPLPAPLGYEELLISVDYRDRNNAYWNESSFRNKILIVNDDENFHEVLAEALKENDYMTLTYKGKPRGNIYVDTKNGPKVTGYMYCGKTEIEGKRVFFDVWVTVKKVEKYNFEIIED